MSKLCECDERCPGYKRLETCSTCRHSCAECPAYQREVQDLKCILSVMIQRRLREVTADAAQTA